MSRYVLIAVRNLWQAKRRTLLLSTALGIVSMLLVLLMSLSQGLTDTMVDSASTLSSGHINVGGFYKAKPGDAYPMITNTQKIRDVVQKTLPDIKLLIDRHRGWGKIINQTGSMQVGMSGVDIDEEKRFVEKIQLATESEYKEGGREEIIGSLEGLKEPNTALLFTAQAKRLEVSVGDSVTLSTESINGAVNTMDVRVVAVARDVGFMSNWSVFVPKNVIRNIYQLNEDTSGAVMVYLEDVERAEEAMAELSVALQKADFRVMERQPTPFWQKFEVVGGEEWVGQKLDLSLWEDEISYMKWAVRGLDSISVFLVGILLVIIIVGIMNSMWIAVRERTQEIGTLRAIGMHRSQIRTMFLIEAAILGFLATTLGSLLGAALALGLDAAGLKVSVDALKTILMSDTLHLTVNFSHIFGATLAFTFFTVVAAYFPARRAARMQPVTAIQRTA